MTSLALYDRIRSAIAEATRIDEVIPILDEIALMKFHARHIKDRALMAEAAELQLRAERHLGAVIKAAKDAGHFRQGRPKNGPSGEPIPIVTLLDVGVDKKLSSRVQQAAGLSDASFDDLIVDMREKIAGNGAIVIDPIKAASKEALTTLRKSQHQARTFTGGKVDDLHKLSGSGFRAKAILADPAWGFIARSEKGNGRSAMQHYGTQTLDAIKALPVKDLAASDCVLFLWMLDWCPHWAMEVIKAWGFEHKTTGFTWVKLTANHDGKPVKQGRISDSDFHFGQGYWSRACPESCWLATRGNPSHIHADVRQLIVAPVMEHSRKPDEIHTRIERLVEGPYLELNARREREGWITWGDEVEFVMPEAEDDAPLIVPPRVNEKPLKFWMA